MPAKQSIAHQKPWNKHNPNPSTTNFLIQMKEYFQSLFSMSLLSFAFFFFLTKK